MSRTSLLKIGVIGLLLLNTALVGFMIWTSQQKPPVMNRGKDNKKVVIQKLKLNDEQVDAYELLIKQHELDRMKFDNDIKNLRKKLYANLQVEGNVNNTDSLYKALSNTHLQLEKVNYNHFMDIKKLCNPDQVPLFLELTNDLATMFGKPQGSKNP